MRYPTRKYVPEGSVLRAFFNSRSPVQVIQGPVGSGTSTCCCHKLWRLAMEQRPNAEGVRRTRWLIVRNTYNDLQETTVKTWLDWFPENVFGDFKRTRPMMHHIRMDLPDRTRVDAEFIFLALDVEDDVSRLMSMEPTGVWFNEIQFIPKAIFDEAQSRVGLARYPPQRQGGPSWNGIIADMNAPPPEHWVPMMRGDVPLPEDWDDEQRREYENIDGFEFFMQPPGLLEVMKEGVVVGYEENPDAENRRWLGEGGYLEIIKGKSRDWINARVMNRVGIYKAGRPVFESFKPEVHTAVEELEAIAGFPLTVGIDFARNPAAVVTQTVRNRLFVLAEFGQENVSAETFAPALKTWLAARFPDWMAPNSDRPGHGIAFFGDPTGDNKGQGTDDTPFRIFRRYGMFVRPAPGNNSISIRLNTIDSLLNGMVDGKPKILVSPACRMLRTGLAGGYAYAKIKGTGLYHPEPHKNRHADFADALQYAALGAGFGAAVVKMPEHARRSPVKMPKQRKSLRR